MTISAGFKSVTYGRLAILSVEVEQTVGVYFMNCNSLALGKPDVVAGLWLHPLQYLVFAPDDVHNQGAGNGHVFERLPNVSKSRAHVHA